MNIAPVDENNIGVFSKVLAEAAEWLASIGQDMWKVSDMTADKLLERYTLDEMKLCYENGALAGVYVIQWQDRLFWPELKDKESGFLHKLAVCSDFRGKGYGRKLIQSAEELCKAQDIHWLRLNCGTFRPRLRSFYEGSGFKMLDRVFIDNRDQIRYIKKIL